MCQFFIFVICVCLLHHDDISSVQLIDLTAEKVFYYCCEGNICLCRIKLEIIGSWFELVCLWCHMHKFLFIHLHLTSFPLSKLLCSVPIQFLCTNIEFLFRLLTWTSFIYERYETVLFVFVFLESVMLSYWAISKPSSYKFFWRFNVKYKSTNVFSVIIWQEF